MEFFDKLVIPQSAENLILLKYLLGLALILLLPYLGFLLTSIFYSVFYNVAGRKQNNQNYIRFSKDIINLASSGKIASIGLGVLPAVSIIILYGQFLHGSEADVRGVLSVAALLIVAGIMLVYAYEYTINLDSVLQAVRGANDNKVKKEADASDLGNFIISNLSANKKSGFWGIVFLFIALFLITGSIITSYNFAETHCKVPLLYLIFSVKTLIKFIFFLLASFLLTSGAVSFYYFRFRPEEMLDKEYLEFLKKFSIKSAIIPIISMPAVVLINLLLTPGGVLSSTFFLFTVIILFILFVIVHLYYALLKKWSSTNIAYAFYLIIVLFVISIINDQTAFSYSAQKHTALLASKYEKAVAVEKERTGKVAVLSGK